MVLPEHERRTAEPGTIGGLGEEGIRRGLCVCVGVCVGTVGWCVFCVSAQVEVKCRVFGNEKVQRVELS